MTCCTRSLHWSYDRKSHPHYNDIKAKKFTYFEILNEAFHETKKVLCSPDITRHCLCSTGKQSSSHVTTMLGSHDTNLVEFHQGELQYVRYRFDKSKI
jgi:hypothetical protein